MTTKSKFETFYVQSMASECDSGEIILPEDQYVNPIVLNEILEANIPSLAIPLAKWRCG